jgi:hypothetical protein
MTFLSASVGGGPRRTSTPAPEIISRSSSRPLTRSTPTSKITRELGLVLAKSSTSISTMPRGNKNLSYMHEHQQIRVEFIKQSSDRQESSGRNQKKKYEVPSRPEGSDGLDGVVVPALEEVTSHPPY